MVASRAVLFYRPDAANDVHSSTPTQTVYVPPSTATIKRMLRCLCTVGFLPGTGAEEMLRRKEVSSSKRLGLEQVDVVHRELGASFYGVKRSNPHFATCSGEERAIPCTLAIE